MFHHQTSVNGSLPQRREFIIHSMALDVYSERLLDNPDNVIHPIRERYRQDRVDLLREI